MTMVLHDDSPLTLPKILQYAQICRSWRQRVAEYLYHEEPNPIGLLHEAAERNVVGVVWLLIDRSDFDQGTPRTFKIYNLLSVAAKSNALAVVMILLQRSNGCLNRYQRNTLLHDAARANAVDVMRVLFDRFDTPRGAVDRDLLTHVAIKANAIDVVRMLGDEHSISVTKVFPCLALRVEYKRVWTMLHTACFYGHVEMVKLLVGRFEALRGKGQQYVNDLALLALRNGQAIMFLTLVEEYGADFDCL
jgi:ankyrin repeat protein